MTNPIINNANTATQRAATDAAVAMASTGAADLEKETPPAPTVQTPGVKLELAVDSGFSQTDKITNNGQVNVSGIPADARWIWSGDGGISWNFPKKGASGPIVVTGDGAKSVIVKVQEKGGKVTTSQLDFTLDTVAPTIYKEIEIFHTSNILLTGTAEKGAEVFIHTVDFLELSARASQKDGTWEIPLQWTRKISGLTKVDGSVSAANGEYNALSATETHRLKQSFSDDFSPTGKALLDTTREAYSMTTSGETWYLWAQIGGGYVISRQSGTDEWYRETDFSRYLKADVGNDSKHRPSSDTKWIATDLPAPHLAAEVALEDGTRAHQKALPLLSFGMAAEETAFYLQQEDRAGNVSANSGFRLFIDTTSPENFVPGLGKFESGSISRHYVTNADLSTGTRFAPSADFSGSTAVNAAHLYFRLSGNALQATKDELAVEGEFGPYHSGEDMYNRTINGVENVEFHYSSGRNELWINHSKDGAFSKEQIERLIQAVKLINTAGSTGTRVLTMHTSEDVGDMAWQGTLEVANERLALPADPNVAASKDEAIRYIATAGALGQGISLQKAVLEPAAKDISSLQLTLLGKGVNPEHDRLLIDLPKDKGNEVANALRSAFDPEKHTLTISNSSGALLSGNQIQTLIKSVKLVNPLGLEGEREVQFRLIATNGEVGGPARAKLVVDTQAPTLDLDYFTPGIQSSSQKVINLKRAADGESLFDKRIGASFADDIATIKLSFSGDMDTFGSDQVVLNAEANGTLALAKNQNATNQTIGGITGLTYAYDRGTSTLSLQKTSGKSLTGLETKQILEALKLKATSTALDYRNIDITVSDHAGNSSLAKARIKLDTTPAPEIKAELVAQNQMSYQVLNLGDTLGRVNSHNLSKGESVLLAKPAGMSAQNFLAAIKGISADWGGVGITGNANTTSSLFKSYQGFDQPLTAGKNFVLAHQGGPYVKAGIFNFTLTPDGKGVMLNHKGGGNVAHQDMHELGGFTQTSNGNYDIGNVRILYQVDTGASNLNPTFNVKFDAKKASVGDVISLITADHATTSKVLTAEDLASPQAAVSLKVANSLSAAQHTIEVQYKEVSGNISQVESVVTPARPGNVANPVLSELKVASPTNARIKLLDDSPTQYASITENGTAASPGSSERGLVFSGKVGGAGASDQYLVTVKAGDKVLAFDTVKAGNFTLASAANLLAPGVYDDLSFTATNITAGNNNGATASVGGLKLGSFWAAQSLGDTRGGNGNDTILLGATKNGANTLIQTNGGYDTLSLGAFGKKGNFAATVTDFSLGVDKLAVFGKNVDALNLDKFVKEVAPIQGGTGTRLVIDLDGAGAGTQTYSLHLQNVAYNPANTHTLFGV